MRGSAESLRGFAEARIELIEAPVGLFKALTGLAEALTGLAKWDGHKHKRTHGQTDPPTYKHMRTQNPIIKEISP